MLRLCTRTTLGKKKPDTLLPVLAITYGIVRSINYNVTIESKGKSLRMLDHTGEETPTPHPGGNHTLFPRSIILQFSCILEGG